VLEALPHPYGEKLNQQQQLPDQLEEMPHWLS
jgi:hypothetical protein